MREPIEVADVDILRDRVRCPTCGRWVGRLLVTMTGRLVCEACLKCSRE